MVDINAKTPYRKGTYECFAAEENHCRYEMHNPQRYVARQFKVDGEVFEKGTKPERCDWLLLNDTKKNAYYIELKGKSIPKAIKQIDQTVDDIHPSISQYRIHCRIVYHTGSHDVAGSEVTQWKKKYRGRAVIKSRRLIEYFC